MKKKTFIIVTYVFCVVMISEVWFSIWTFEEMLKLIPPARASCVFGILIILLMIQSGIYSTWAYLQTKNPLK